ncbi:hypothetical protein PT276_08075 [Orbaceae bacterium ESL0721]|nr:hypothetical protein [Orbaceae bacterium ESL0721]
MSKRLEILKNSLAKKEALLDSKIQNHFDTVKQTNGQPLNDKRIGTATFKKWEKQNESIKNVEVSIEKTKEAIEREERKIAIVENFKIPKYLRDAIDNGKITQWRKFPRFFFVNGVDKGRIVLLENGVLAHRYLRDVPKEQYPIFRDVFNALNAQSKAYLESNS